MQTRRTGSTDLIPIDLEIEATVRKQGSKRRRNKNKQQEIMAEPPTAKPLWQYGVPDAATSVMSSILRLAVTATHFELKPQAKEWLKDEGIGTFDSWDKLVKAFFVKFLGQEKTARLRTELSTLCQLDDESLYEYSRRFKHLQRKCLHHGIQEWLLIQTFYNGLTHEYRIYIDAASGSNFIEKVPTKAKALLEKMAANDNFHSGGRNSAKKRGKHDVDAMTLLISTMQALSLKVDQLREGPSVVASCETCGVQGRITSECQYVEMLMEQDNALYNNNQQRRPYDPYSNTYNEAQQIQAQTKLMENQISQLAQQVGQSSKVPGHFLGNTEQPPKGQINVVTLRNGRELKDLPPKAKLEMKYGKFLDILKKLQINILFLDAISEMPSYAKFLKDMLSNKREIKENAIVSLTAECSAILQNKLPKKLGDPMSYSILVKLGDIEIKKALFDLGASVSLMPLSICKKLQMGELKPTRISLQLADRSVKFPLGILKDVPLRVRKLFIPCDFVVMEMEEDAQVPIILGRPFLATVGATIDMKNGKITFEVGDEKVEYSLTSSMGSPSKEETIYRVDALDEAVEAKAVDLQLDDSLQMILMRSADEED
eukprot:XP_015583461.1 uncharacterized protein LOC107262405 [Ricinus communis]